MRRVATAVLVALFASIGAVHLASAAGADTDPDSAEAQFVGLINQLRTNNGLNPLVVDSGLQSIAEQWAQRMASANGIRHNPDFVHQVDSQVTTEWTKLGENVGWDYSVQDLFNAFVNSPKHYDNLVEPTYTRLGVGVAVTPSGQIFTSHEFFSNDPSNVRSSGSADDSDVAAPPPVTYTPAEPIVMRQVPPPVSAFRRSAGVVTAVVPAPVLAAVPAAQPASADPVGPPTQFVFSLQQLTTFDPSRDRPRTPAASTLTPSGK